MNTTFKLNKTVATLILSMSLPLASNAIAHGQENKSANSHCEHTTKQGMHGGMHQYSKLYYLKDVGLTDAQKDQIFSMQHAQLPKMREQYQTQYKLMQEMRETAQADQFDEAKAQSIASQMATLTQDKILARAKNQASIFALLTP